RDATTEVSTTTAITTTTGAVPVTGELYIDTFEVLPDPATVPWLEPVVSPPRLRLLAAERGYATTFVCPPNASCVPNVAKATLRYGADEVGSERRVLIEQYFGEATADLEPQPNDTIGVRSVERGAGEVIRWREESGVLVVVSPLGGIASDEITAIVDSLQVGTTDVWPRWGIEAPAMLCVDAASRYAPLTPEGWQRFVLDVVPDGGCTGHTVLFMSLVLPPTDDDAGALATFVFSADPTSSRTRPDDAETVEIDGITVTIDRSVRDVRGLPAVGVVMPFGPVSLDAHGYLSPERLAALVRTVALVDATEWATLQAEAAAIREAAGTTTDTIDIPQATDDVTVPGGG
ncbi:MAG TPA: hypothetical protein PLV68_03480, partial [Ilumatobacteraceae bacterium]|nr:hypothetical protein [Ilumatobacteraceae bacterium]